MFRSTIGFDRLPSLLADALEREDLGFPPYNIEKIGEDQFRIVMAVAGFDARDLEIVQKHNRVSVRGRVQQEPERNYLYRGIAGRAFARDFDLADHVEVTDGILVAKVAGNAVAEARRNRCQHVPLDRREKGRGSRMKFIA
jgi:molecular chaperone IbpA